MATGMPAVTPGSDFGTEGNCCPLLLQDIPPSCGSGTGHATASGFAVLARSVGLDVVTCPSRSILQLCPARTPSPSPPCDPGLCPAGCLCPAGTTSEPPWDDGSRTFWGHLAVPSVLSSPNLHIPSGFSQAEAGLGYAPPACPQPRIMPSPAIQCGQTHPLQKESLSQSFSPVKTGRASPRAGGAAPCPQAACHRAPCCPLPVQ